MKISFRAASKYSAFGNFLYLSRWIAFLRKSVAWHLRQRNDAEMDAYGLAYRLRLQSALQRRRSCLSGLQA